MMFPSSRCLSASLPSFRSTSLSASVSCCGVVSCPSPYFLFFLFVWTSRKCEYRSVRVLGSSPLWLVVNMCSRTVALIQQKTGIWHMMWRLLDVLMCEMILLHSSSSLNLLLKYSSFWASVKPRTSVTLSTHAGGIWLAAAGLEVIQTRAEGSRFPRMRFVSSTLTDDLCVTSDTSSLWLKSRGSLLSSRPSKMNKGLQTASVSAVSFCNAGWKTRSSVRRLCCWSFTRFSSLNESTVSRPTSWFSKPSAQSRVNFCTEKVFPTPATPLVRTTLMLLCWSVEALKMSWHLMGASWRIFLLEAVSSCLTSCWVLTSSLCPSVM